jgi:transcriptional regulator with XRE-family HTH domain
MSVGKRLRQAIINKGINLKEFSKNSKIPYRTLQEYLTDSRMPGGESLIKIDAELSINISWLLTGKGKIYQTETTTKEIPTEKWITKWLSTWWKGADEEDKHWLNGQMKRQFPEYAEWREQEEKKDKEN